MCQERDSILIIDDDPDVAQVLRLMLARVGLSAVIAQDERAGTAAARAALPVLVLCDERLGGRDGYALLFNLQHDPATSHIPVIMMGGTSENGMRDWAKAGAVNFLYKPFGADQLLAVVRQHLPQSPNGRAPS